jgi:hypothetical protein
VGITSPSAKLHVSGNLLVSNGITGSLFGTSSWASNAISSSYALTASYALNGGGGGEGVTSITAGNGLSGGTITTTGTISLDTSSAHFITGSRNVTSSWATNAISASFAQTASAVTGSLQIIGMAEFTEGATVSGGLYIVATDSTAANKPLILNTSTGQIHTTASVFATTTANRFVGNQVITGSLAISGSGTEINGPFLYRIVFNSQAGNYTLALADEGKLVLMTSGGANIVTVPSSSTVNFAIGAQVMVTQGGAGQTRFTSASTGVTLNSLTSARRISGQYGEARLIKTAANTWYIFGNLTV